MKIGYKGISPYSKAREEHIDQAELLIDCDKIIEEKATDFGEKMTLMPTLKSLNIGDELVVCSLRFLAQDTKTLISHIQLIEHKGAKLTVLDMENGLSGHFKALKEFEHYVKSAKIKRGKNLSKRVQGRKPIDRDTVLRVKGLNKHSKISISEIARETGISRRSVNRILNEEVK